MKELSIEDKAKRYDEAIERAKNTIEVNQTIPDIVECVESLFSELKESEDERIKKAIIGYIDHGQHYGVSNKDMIAWIEKQGNKPQGKSAVEAIKEEKVDNAIKVEPKFHEGDWIVDMEDRELFYVSKVLDSTYELVASANDGDDYHMPHYTVDDNYRLWTINDAKNGDVLVHNNCTFIFMGIKDGIVQALEEHLLDGTYPVSFGESDKDNDYCPATKEQRDTLMKAMADAGYAFDFDKKELKKIEQESDWSEDNLPEFESYLCLMFQKFRTKGICTNGEIIDFVEEHSQKLKDTLCHAWSEEDERKFSDILALLRGGENCHYNTPVLSTWLKSLKDRVGCEANCTTTKEWSEEDEKNFARVDYACLKVYGGDSYSSDWLRKFLGIHKKWKPSEEQMDALNDVIIYVKDSMFPSKNVLKKLYEQLKKIRKE